MEVWWNKKQQSKSPIRKKYSMKMDENLCNGSSIILTEHTEVIGEIAI